MKTCRFTEQEMEQLSSDQIADRLRDAGFEFADGANDTVFLRPLRLPGLVGDICKTVTKKGTEYTIGQGSAAEVEEFTLSMSVADYERMQKELSDRLRVNA